MSEENSSINEHIARLNKESKTYRQRARDYRTQLEKMKTEFEALKTELEGMKAQPQPIEELGRLKAEMAKRDHRSVFDKVADAAGIPTESREAAWKLAEVNPEGEAQEATYKEVVGKLVQANPFLIPSAPARPGPGYSKGAPLDASAKKQVRRSDASNLEWQMKNPSWLSEITKGNLELID